MWWCDCIIQCVINLIHQTASSCSFCRSFRYIKLHTNYPAYSVAFLFLSSLVFDTMLFNMIFHWIRCVYCIFYEKVLRSQGFLSAAVTKEAAFFQKDWKVVAPTFFLSHKFCWMDSDFAARPQKLQSPVLSACLSNSCVVKVSHHCWHPTCDLWPLWWPLCWPLCCVFFHLPSCSLTSTGGEPGAAAVRRALPVPAQRLAGVGCRPLRGSAGGSRLRQHLLLHQQGGQARALSHGLSYFIPVTV